MQMAIENLQIAKDLTIDDYTVVYLSRYQGDGEALARLVERLTKEEVIELLQARLQAPPEGPTALPTSAPRAVGIMQLQLESSKN